MTVLSLEEALAHYVAQLSAGRLAGLRLQAMVERLGLGGDPPVSRAEAGRRMGVSDERVRQIEHWLRGRQDVGLGTVPELDAALAVVAAAAPVRAGEVGRLLRQRGVSSRAFDYPSLVAAAGFLGLKLPVVAVGQGSDAVLVPPSSTRANLDLGRLWTAARRLVEFRGAATVEELRGEVAVRPSVLRTVIDTDQRFRREGDWYWMPAETTAGHFADSTRRMLSVTSPLAVDVLRGGLARRLAMRGRSSSPPPVDVLARVYESSPAFKLDSRGCVWPALELEREVTLGSLQRRVVELLESSPGGSLPRDDLLAACRAEGMNLNSVQWFLTYSECFERPSRGRIAFRGASPNPGPASRRARRRAHGLTAGGRAWMAVEVDVALISNGVLYVPSAIRAGLVGATVVVGRRRIGVDAKGNSWGWRAVLGDVGAAPGTVLRVTMSAQDGSGAVELGGEELLAAPEDRT